MKLIGSPHPLVIGDVLDIPPKLVSGELDHKSVVALDSKVELGDPGHDDHRDQQQGGEDDPAVNHEVTASDSGLVRSSPPTDGSDKS